MAEPKTGVAPQIPPDQPEGTEPEDEKTRKRTGRRTIGKLVYFDQSELTQVTEAAKRARVPLARYIRESVLGAAPPPAKLPPNAEALAELARIGTNINQLARVANTAGAQRVEAATVAALAELMETVKRL